MYKYKIYWEADNKKNIKVYDDYNSAIKARNYLQKNGVDYVEISVILKRKEENVSQTKI